MLQKDLKRANMGSGSYLHRGRWKPFVVLENFLENSDVSLTPVSIGLGGGEGNSQRSPTGRSDRAGTTSNQGNVSLRPGPEFFPLCRKGETYILDSNL